MNDFVRKVSEYDVERSLLQKAVRRGYADLAERVVNYLLSVDDRAWLRKRLFVIAYEECWPIGSNLGGLNLVSEYRRIANSVKNKNASGLAQLASLCNKRNSHFPRLSEEQQSELINFAQAITNKSTFWTYLETQTGYGANKMRILSAEKAIPMASFDGDKDVMFAAAYLASTGNVPQVETSLLEEEHDFPYWVAIDKHTDLGKQIFHEISETVGIDSFVAMKIAFYVGGSACNQMSDSPYWDELVRWEMNNLHETTSAQALAYWDQMRPLIIERTRRDVSALVNRISNPTVESDDSQPSLF